MSALSLPRRATFRRPSDRAALYAWHARALELLQRTGNASLKELAREDFELVPPIHEDEPQCGWFLAHVRRWAVPVPARIWLKSVVDDDGDLVEPEVLLCELGGEPFDAMIAWPKVCIRPIPRSEYLYLMNVRAWAKSSAPDQPQAKTGQVIDWLTLKLPEIPATPVAQKRKK